MTALNLWFFPIAVAAVHGIFLAFVFLIKKNNRLANRWFAFLLLAISLHLVEYSISISGLIFKFPHLMFVTYPLFFVIAPFFYLYVREYLHHPHKKYWQVALHFIPALLVFFSMLPFYLQSSTYKLGSFLPLLRMHSK